MYFFLLQEEHKQDNRKTFVKPTRKKIEEVGACALEVSWAFSQHNYEYAIVYVTLKQQNLYLFDNAQIDTQI